MSYRVTDKSGGLLGNAILLHVAQLASPLEQRWFVNHMKSGRAINGSGTRYFLRLGVDYVAYCICNVVGCDVDSPGGS